MAKAIALRCPRCGTLSSVPHCNNEVTGKKCTWRLCTQCKRREGTVLENVVIILVFDANKNSFEWERQHYGKL